VRLVALHTAVVVFVVVAEGGLAVLVWSYPCHEPVAMGAVRWSSTRRKEGRRILAGATEGKMINSHVYLSKNS
jgi:hypothetical protein